MGERTDTQHVVDEQLGGSGRRSSSLRVLQPISLPDGWELREDVPRSRAECRSRELGVTVPCPHYHCRYHLWLVEPDARPGRRHQEGGAPESTLRPSTPTTCAMLVAESGAQTFGAIGELFGITDEGVRVILEKATRKLARLGYTVEDLLAPETAP